MEKMLPGPGELKDVKLLIFHWTLSLGMTSFTSIIILALQTASPTPNAIV